MGAWIAASMTIYSICLLKTPTAGLAIKHSNFSHLQRHRRDLIDTGVNRGGYGSIFIKSSLEQGEIKVSQNILHLIFKTAGRVRSDLDLKIVTVCETAKVPARKFVCPEKTQKTYKSYEDLVRKGAHDEKIYCCGKDIKQRCCNHKDFKNDDKGEAAREAHFRKMVIMIVCFAIGIPVLIGIIVCVIVCVCCCKAGSNSAKRAPPPRPVASYVPAGGPSPQGSYGPPPQGAYGVPPPQGAYGGPSPQGGYGGPPPQGGYGGPPPQGGYGGPPPQGGYGGPPPQGGYGGPPPQGGYGGPPPQGGYGGPPPQPGYGRPPPQGPPPPGLYTGQPHQGQYGPPQQ